MSRRLQAVSAPAARAASSSGTSSRANFARPNGNSSTRTTAGPHGTERGEDPLAAHRPRLLDRVARVVADEAAVGADAERRQREHLHAGRRPDALRERAAAQQHDAEALRERPAERVGAHQVAEADRVLAVAEQRRPAHATSSSAARSSGSRRASAAARTRPTAGTATRASTDAAVCQRSTCRLGDRPDLRVAAQQRRGEPLLAGGVEPVLRPRGEQPREHEAEIGGGGPGGRVLEVDERDAAAVEQRVAQVRVAVQVDEVTRAVVAALAKASRARPRPRRGSRGAPGR